MIVVKRGNVTRLKVDGCDKVSYSSRAKAVKAHRGVHARSPGRMKPYECRFCGAWHVSTCRS